MKLSDTTDIGLDQLEEYPGNPRKHTDLQLREMTRSLDMFGQYRPLVVNESNQVLAGNGMLRAMRELGWKKGSAIVLQGANAAEERKLLLADNRIGGMGSTDFDAVDAMLEEIGDFEIPGYDPDTLRSLLATAEESLDAASEYGILDESEIARIQGRGEGVPTHFEADEDEGDYDEGGGEDRPADSAVDVPDSVMDTEERTTSRELQVCPECGHSW